MNLKIERLDMISFAKILGLIQGVIGLLTGTFFTVMYLIDPLFLETNVGGVAPVFGAWSIIVLPILNALLGAFSGVMICFVYNLIVRWTGFKIELKVQG